MEKSKWHMHRIGLVDFWCYENEDFYFKDGHMLLRGSNGSGKSVTMQSFIPLLLDGNRSSERIDSFGTKSRKMDTYLIDENSQRDDRIGYLYLECKREASEVYVTIGMGLHARKNKPLNAWYFVIENNKRVNKDFSLIQNGLTLSKKQLENVLGNQVISTQKEYMKKVNDVLFGFDTIEEYKDFLDLLLKLRAPKLSNSLTPVKIAELLSTSLAPLSDDDLRPMSEAVNSMDVLQDELNNLKLCLEASGKIERNYRIYNEALLVHKYQRWQEEVLSCQKERIELDTIQKTIETQEKMIQDLEIQLRDLQNKKVILENEKSMLVDPDMESKYQQLLAYKKEAEDKEFQQELKRQNYQKKENQKIDIEKYIFQTEDKIYQKEKERDSLLEELEALYTSYPISEFILLKQDPESYPFQDIQKEIKEDQKKTRALQSMYQTYEEIKSKIQNLEDQISQIQSKNKELGNLLRKKELAYKEMIGQYQEMIFQYSAKNEYLKLSKEDLQHIVDYLFEYEVNQTYMPILQVVESVYRKEIELVLKKSNEIQFEINQLSEEKKELSEEYEYWLQKKEFEPVRDEYVQKSRSILSEKGIESVPFYQCLRFKMNLETSQEAIIEEAMQQFHLLDALVVSKKYKEEILRNGQGHDYYLWTNKAINQLEEQEIGSLQELESIFGKMGIEGLNNIQFTETGLHFGEFSSTIDGSITAVLIGQKRREQIRLEKLEQLQLALQTKENEILEKEQTMNVLEQAEKIIKAEWDGFIDEKDLKSSLSEIHIVQKDMDYNQNRLDDLHEKKQAENRKSAAIMKDIKETAETLMIKIDKNSIEMRLDDISSFETYVRDLKSVIETLKSQKELRQMNLDRKEETTEDMDEIHYEIVELEDGLKIIQKSILFLEKKLQNAQYDQKVERLDQTIKELKEIEQLTIQVNRNQSSAQKEIELTLDSKAQKEEEYVASEKKRQMYQEVYEQEQDFHLVKEDQSIEELVQKEFPKKISDYLTALQSVFYENVQYLAQFHLIHEVKELKYDLQDVNSHFLIHANYGGKKIPFLELTSILKKNIEMQNLLIQEEDRHIFEEILVGTIGKKIRERIQMSKKWVGKIERYMQDVNTSSGLQIRIKWKAKDSFEDGMLSTKELVSLLEKDHTMLKEKDLKQISNHFRKRIEKIRKLNADGEEMLSFHQLMKDVMDYRQWFEFVLYGKKPNEAQKELTNKLFYSYSGGEKAIVMYVPLFSAVAAKFEGAKKDAPFIVAMDEAFAGVDENNIDSMFELVEKFKFDYMMTSQSLWGDYPTCKALAIYELYRPNNAAYITKLAYEWNGKRKKSVFL